MVNRVEKYIRILFGRVAIEEWEESEWGKGKSKN